MVTSETVYEDEAMGSSKNMISQEEFAGMDQLVLQKMMMGIDLDEEDEDTRKRKMTQEERETLNETKERISHEIKEVLDFGGYHLGNDGLQAILPMLESEYLLKIKSLDLSYNNLNDVGLDSLI